MTRATLDALIATIATGVKNTAAKIRTVQTAQADYVDQSVAAVSGGTISDGSITNSKLSNVATATFKARNTAGTGSPEDITVSQVKTLLSISNIDNTSDANKPVSTAQATQLNLKAPLASPTFTGIPVVPTAAPGTNTSQAASTAFVGAAVASVSRINPRVQSVTSSATVTPNADTDDAVKVTAQATGLTLANWSGTPVDMQSMMICIKDNGTARTISYGPQYREVGVTLPTTTVINKNIYLGCIYNLGDTKIDVVSFSIEA
jgi:hypothetical protein